MFGHHDAEVLESLFAGINIAMACNQQVGHETAKHGKRADQRDNKGE